MISFVLLGEAGNNQPQKFQHSKQQILLVHKHNMDTECGVWIIYSATWMVGLECFGRIWWEYNEQERRGGNNISKSKNEKRAVLCFQMLI